MFSSHLRRFTSLAASLLLAANSVAFAQSPQLRSDVPVEVTRLDRVPEFGAAVASPRQSPTPAPQPTPVQQTPAQRDAQRPPGTERRSTIPEQGRPRPSDPTRPPGTERPSPQAPPGTQLPSSTTTRPGQIQPEQPTVVTDPTLQVTPTPNPEDEPPAPNFPIEQPRPVPPMPSLTRLGVQAGNSLPLTLNEAIRRALENNNDIQVARDDVRYNETVLRSFEGIFDPVFTFTPEINNSVQPVSSTLAGSSAGSTVSTTNINNDFSVNKQFSRGGGNYTYFFNNTRQTTNSRFTTLIPFYSSNQGISFTQPLWRNRSIDRNRQQIRIQRKRLEQSDADFRRSTIDVISQVQRAYWDLVFALRDQQNQIANLNLARENFRRTEASVAAGASAPLERAEVQTELSNRESQLLSSTQRVSVAENTLKRLIIRDPASPDWTAEYVPTDAPKFDETPVNLNEALDEARKNRPELRRLKLQDEITNIDIQFFKNQTKPRVDINATLSTTGLAGTPNPNLIDPGGEVPIIPGDPTSNADAFLLAQINQLRASQGLPPATVPTVVVPGTNVPGNLQGGYFKTLQNVFSFDTRNIVAGVTIQLPFKNKTAQANLAGAQILKEQLQATLRSQEQFIEVEVRNAAQAVDTERRRVLAAREARRNAELQLQGEQRLYQVGRSTTFLLFQRENTLVNARNAELRAETDYNKALADLQRATSTTLRTNNIVLESPVGQ